MHKLTTEEFIKRAKQVHGDKYDYSNSVYINSYTHINIKCNKCNSTFYQIPSHHLKGSGCTKCFYSKITKKEITFLNEAYKVHGSKYDYSNIFYINNHTKIKIGCNQCKSYFYQIPSSHLNGKGCPHCNSSHGEEQVRSYLVEHNIKFEEQKRFKDCRDKLPLPFDFYLPDYNLCIEYQGEQHYKIKERFGGINEFNILISHDTAKRNWCKISNNPNLLEIKYTDNIEEILSQILKNT